MNSVGIFYGSTTGNSEDVAKELVQAFGADKAECFDVANAKASDLEKFDNIILGTSTWGIGDMQEDFEDFIDEIAKADLLNKKVAIFGLGDQDGYPDSFVDAMGEIYEALKDKGCKLIGQTSPDSYTFDESRAIVDDQFVGLPIDSDNQEGLTSERINSWTEQLKINLI